MEVNIRLWEKRERKRVGEGREGGGRERNVTELYSQLLIM